MNHVKVLKAEEEEAAHWAEMWERSQNGEDVADLGMKPRYVGLLFGPTAMGKSTYVKLTVDRKSTRLNSSHSAKSRMPSSA